MILRDAILHLMLYQSTIAQWIVWTLLTSVIVFLTVMIVRRRQSAYRVLELKKAIRVERAQYKADVAMLNDRIEKILSRCFPATVEYVRSAIEEPKNVMHFL